MIVMTAMTIMPVLKPVAPDTETPIKTVFAPRPQITGAESIHTPYLGLPDQAVGGVLAKRPHQLEAPGQLLHVDCIVLDVQPRAPDARWPGVVRLESLGRVKKVRC
jgi:hypothetical protein